MRIKIAKGKRYAGPLGNFGSGALVNLPDADAKALIDGGYAEAVSEAPEAAAIEPNGETATLDAAPKKRTRKSKGKKVTGAREDE